MTLVWHVKIKHHINTTLHKCVMLCIKYVIAVFENLMDYALYEPMIGLAQYKPLVQLTPIIDKYINLIN